MSTPKNQILLFFLLFISNLEAQEEFQHRFYNSYSTTAHKILPYDGAYYVLGGEQSAPDELPLATLSKIDAAGIEQWVLRLEIPSVWNDILVTGNGGLLLIGDTLPNNDQSNALIASETSIGNFHRAYSDR